MAKNVVFIMYHEGTGETAVPQLLATAYGYQLYRIDTVGDLVPGPTVFADLDAALDDLRFVGWTWYFFDENASDGLKSIGHQADNAVYVFGHDVDGFGRSNDQLPGALVYLNSALAPTFKHPASQVAISVIVQRFYQVDA